MKTYFTSESVTCGHPDKVCDQIADAVLDDILANDPDAHVACEVTACTGEVHLMGEITSSYVPDYEAIARKVIADTYGGMARHGGGAFSGKDPSKVDRTGAYMARYLAKNIVAAELADRCEIELAYAIGLADPVSVMVDTFGTGRVSDEKIASWLMEHIDMRPGSITSRFELRRPIYRRVSCGGHFGENAVGLPWEWTDIAEVLQKEILS